MKFTLVVQGGSMRGIYAAGVLDAFIEEGLYPSLAFGTSAGSLMTANFLIGDYQGAKRSVLALAYDKEFLAARYFVKTGGLFDFQYLFDVAPERLGFSKEKLMASPCRFYAVATELETGCSALFGKTDPDFWTGIAASCSIPLLCRHRYRRCACDNFPPSPIPDVPGQSGQETSVSSRSRRLPGDGRHLPARQILRRGSQYC